jgi:hypothetical protein
MRRLLINTLAVIGAITLLGAVAGFVIDRIARPTTGIVLGSDDKPLAHVPVFLDRGGVAIERFVTDSAGVFALPLEPREIRRALWLICAPGAIPMVGDRDERQVGPTTYQYGRLSDSTWNAYRAFGWRGPIPRECPKGTDSVGWRYPPSAGKAKYDFTTTEPEWPR